MRLGNKFSNTGTMSMGDLLQHDTKFCVPSFQRDYLWKTEQVDDLWIDLMERYQEFYGIPKHNNEIEYLLGPIVLQRAKKNDQDGLNKYWIIDGQQRLATLTLLFCAVRNIMIENGMDEKIDEIKNLIIREHNDFQTCKLELNNDKADFRKIQNFQENQDPQLAYIKNMKNTLGKNYVRIHEKIVRSLYTDFINKDKVNINKLIPIIIQLSNIQQEDKFINQSNVLHDIIEGRIKIKLDDLPDDGLKDKFRKFINPVLEIRLDSNDLEPELKEIAENKHSKECENQQEDLINFELEKMLITMKKENLKEMLNDENTIKLNLINRLKNFISTNKEEENYLPKGNFVNKFEKLLEKKLEAMTEIRMETKMYDLLERNIDSKWKEQKSGKKIYGIKKNISMLHNFLTHILENNYVVVITVDEEEDAFTVFDTLNGKGEKLTQSALIKNYVINNAWDENRDEVQNSWNGIFNQILDKKQDQDGFIMQSFQSRYPLESISKNKLFKTIQEKIKKSNQGKDGCKMFVDELCIDAEFFAKISQKDISAYVSAYPELSPLTKDYIRGMNYLNAVFMRVPLLAAYRTWGHEPQHHRNYEIFVKNLAIFFFRFRVVRNKDASSVQNVLIKNITTKILNDDAPDVIGEILNTFREYDGITDEQFITLFNDEMMKTSVDIARYILLEIELHKRRISGRHADANIPHPMTLEHILPKDHRKWDNMTEAVKNKFVNRLGNLTLLTPNDNPRNSNEVFENKRKTFRNSSFIINNEIGDIPDWNDEIIQQRETDFSDIINEMWRLD